MKKIYAFDFDGTIVENEFPKIGKPIDQTINLIKQVKENGDYIILNTMREGHLLEEAVEFCKKLEIEFDAVNDNLPHMKEFYKNNPRKIFANYYVDDHNYFLTGINKVLSYNDYSAINSCIRHNNNYCFVISEHCSVSSFDEERGCQRIKDAMKKLEELV